MESNKIYLLISVLVSDSPRDNPIRPCDQLFLDALRRTLSSHSSSFSLCG